MSNMWKYYDVELHFTTPFASGTPKNPRDIEAMLEARMPAKPPEDAVPLPELAEQIATEVEAEPEVERGYATFKRDDKGLYYEARCVRAHLKDCSNQLQIFLGIKALKAKVANHVYVQPVKLYLGKTKPDAAAVMERPPDEPWKIIDVVPDPDGNEIRIVHAMTMKGPRSSLKTIDYVDNGVLKFTLKVLDDRVIKRDILEAIFEYGGTHGIGQERSQGWGQYEYKFAEVP